MIRNRSKRLETLMRLSQAETDQVAQGLARGAKALTDYESKLGQLQACRIEYSQQLQMEASVAMDSAQIKSFMSFIQKLDEAIAQVEAQIATRRRAMEQDQEHWLRARNKTQVLEGVASRYRGSEEHTRQNREQLESDELAQRRGGDPEGERCA